MKDEKIRLLRKGRISKINPLVLLALVGAVILIVNTGRVDVIPTTPDQNTPEPGNQGLTRTPTTGGIQLAQAVTTTLRPPRPPRPIIIRPTHPPPPPRL